MRIKKKVFLQILFAVWVVLWVVFLIREDKDGQYRMLRDLYGLEGEEKSRYVLGGELYDLMVFCRQSIPQGSTYEILGFEKYSIDEVRARYFLWPLRAGSRDTDFKIACRGTGAPPGYVEYKRFDGNGCLLVKKGSSL